MRERCEGQRANINESEREGEGKAKQANLHRQRKGAELNNVGVILGCGDVSHLSGLH